VDPATKHRPTWTLISTQGLVLIYVARNPGAAIPRIARAIGLTQRHVIKVVRDLRDGGLLVVERHGRRNEYTVNLKNRQIHPDVPVSLEGFLRLVEESKDCLQ